jgi:hypothetical protein
MPLTKHQRRDLVRVSQSDDFVAIATAIRTVMRANSDATLLDIKVALRVRRSIAALNPEK